MSFSYTQRKGLAVSCAESQDDKLVKTRSNAMLKSADDLDCFATGGDLSRMYAGPFITRVVLGVINSNQRNPNCPRIQSTKDLCLIFQIRHYTVNLSNHFRSKCLHLGSDFDVCYRTALDHITLYGRWIHRRYAFSERTISSSTDSSRDTIPAIHDHLAVHNPGDKFRRPVQRHEIIIQVLSDPIACRGLSMQVGLALECSSELGE